MSILYNKKMNKDELLKLAYKIKYARDKKGLSQEKLAELADVGMSTVTKLERGVGNITLKNLYKIAEVLDLNLGIINNKEL